MNKMEDVGYNKGPILISGNDRLTFSLVVCILQAGQNVILHTEDNEKASDSINAHLADIHGISDKLFVQGTLEMTKRLTPGTDCSLAIAISNENLDEKRSVIRQLEAIVDRDTIIAINTESILLSSLQEGAVNPDRILGANWSELVHTTYFLELIANEHTQQGLVDRVYHLAKAHWKKDPYIISADQGIRARMLSAIAREAFYLVENGYASIEDIDRACRNDPGYYLSFAGNFRYMDLMGACGYGEVMKDLNPELSKAKQVPRFFKNLIQQGRLGIENRKGLYDYKEGDGEAWDKTFRRYSYQIREIIEKYPFRYMEDE